MIKIKQKFDNSHIEDIEPIVWEQCESTGTCISKGSRIAIAVGSRGISNIVRIVKAVVDWIRSKGGEPFIIPAMGSHGGATSLGQIQVLKALGISEDTMKVPVCSTMDVVKLDSGPLESSVFIDRFAYEADGIILINRIKPHTSFHGDYESGLVKLCVVGMGKQKQAEEIHRYGLYGLKHLLLPTFHQIRSQVNILFGLGIIENAYHQTKKISALRPEHIEDGETELLCEAKECMACLPLDKIDLLIVDEFGKNISGLGMDTNIIGRLYIRGEKEPEKPDIKCILARSLTEESRGNAEGIGLADIVTRNVLEKVDFSVTAENVITCGFLERGKIPIVAEDDKQALEYAFRIIGKEHSLLKIVRIHNTLRLDELLVSECVLDDIKNNKNIEITNEKYPLINEIGGIPPFV